MKLTIRLKGGPGSGFYGHKGRKGQEGGSLPRDASQSADSYLDMNKVPSIGDEVVIKIPYEGDKIGKVVKITEVDMNRSTPTVHLDTGWSGPMNVVYPTINSRKFEGLDELLTENETGRLTKQYGKLQPDKLYTKVLSELSKRHRDYNDHPRKWNDLEKKQIIEWIDVYRRFL